MSSNDKRDLTTKGTTSKAAGPENTVTGDIVTLPPDADDVIFSTICDSSVIGTVDAELEMSYDKENWCPAVTEEYTEGDSVVGWGNERYVLTKVTDQDKNKHGRGAKTFDASGNELGEGDTTEDEDKRDVLFNFIQRDKPFNLSWWHKSEDQPSATYKPIIFRHGNKDPFTNNKHLNLLPDAANNEKKNKHLHAPANIGVPARDIFHEKMGADKSFTINKWFKSSVEPNATDSSPVLFNNGATDGSSFGNGLTASFTKKVVTSPWGNTKYYQAYQHWGNKASRILSDNVATGSAPLIRYDRDWTISWWMKTSSSANAYYHTWGFQGTVSTYSTQTGTGFENEFGMSFDTGRFRFIFTNSSGTQVQKNLYWNGGEMDGGPTDDEWHFYTLTFNANGATSGDFEFQPSNALSTASNSNPDTQRSMTFYVDGQVFNNDAALTGGASQNLLGTVSDCEITSGNKEWYWVEQHHDNNNVPVGEYNQFAVYNEYMTASQVADLYDGTPGTKGGNPTNVSALSSCKVALDFNDDTYANTDSTEFEFTNSAFSGAWASDPYPSKRDTTQAGASTQSLSSSDATYVAMTVVNTFDATASQGTSFLLSLDGFESTSDAWVSYPVGSLLDGNWHNMQITWDGSGPGSKTYGDSTETNNNLRVYIDGEWLAPNAYKGGTSTFTSADKHFKWTTGTFVPGTFGASGWKETSSSTDYEYAFQGAFDQLSLHSEVTDLTKAQEFYGKGTIYEGQPHNYQMSDSLTYANVEGWWTFDEDGDFTSGTANDKTSNNIDLTLKYFDSNGNNLTSNSGQSTYIAPIGRAIGEGFTVSITKNLKDDGTWVTTQDQTTRLVISFNGIESLADHFVAYDVNQTSLDKPTNLLDGLWHNVVISFQGTTDNSGTTYLDDNEIRFGPVSQGSTDQAFHIAVSFDGHKLTGISPLGAVDDGSGGTLSGIAGWNVSKKLASGKMEAGFIIEQKDLRHVNTAATYVPTTYLASGIVEAEGADSIYAFQGGFDESSFHSDNWWIDEAGTTVSPTQYNAEKAKTIYGNTGGLAPAQLTRRSPYDLLDPSSIGATSGSNQYVNPNPYDASSNPSGGVEVYYRWGDITGDCSSSVNDVRSSAADSDARDLSVSLGSMNHSTALDTDASGATDFEKDLTYDNSGTYTMYVEKSTSTTEGGLNTKNVKISGCAASKCQQQSILAPKLPHMRVKWTGSGSCDLGEDKCRAQLWFRRRKK